MNKHFTATVQINRIKKEFIIDTGSPISIMPPDERIMKATEIQKITKILSCEQKRGEILGEKSGEHRI